MTPRTMTPPLAIHLDTSAPGMQCPCGCGLHSGSSWGPSCIEFLEEIWGWTLLPWQKFLYFHALEKRIDGTGFRFPTVVVLVGRQQGKLIDVDTPVLTTDGFKTMNTIEAGDHVFHPDGHPIEVLAAHPVSYENTCYRVRTTDGREVIADAEHQWAVQDRRCVSKKGARGEKPVKTYAWEVLTTQQILDRGLERRPNATRHDYAFRLPNQKCLISKPVSLPIDPYVLGYWLGDGTSASAEITVGNQDLENTVSNLLAAGVRLVSTTPNGNSWRVRINVGTGIRDGFESRCRRLGVWKNKHVPDQYLTAGTEQRQALLAGLLDSDGSITKYETRSTGWHSGGQVEFTSTNQRLADAVLYLARSLGYRAVLGTGRATLYGKDCGPKYRVQFTPTDNPFRLIRKAARVAPIPNGDRSAISISSITPVENRPMRCITVDSLDGRWLVGRDLMPTHNSKWIKGLGLWRLFMSEYGLASATCPAARLAVIAAQNLDYAEGMLKEVVDEIREHRLFSRELINHRECLDVETPMLTTAGWKKMDTLAVGDEVYHPDGHPVEVLEVHPQHVGRDCYRVTTTDGRSVVTDGTHRWRVQDYRNGHSASTWETVTTEELLDRGLTYDKGYAIKLPSQQEIVSKPVDLPIDPYLLGVWLGDGHHKDNALTLGSQDSDEILSRLQNITIIKRYPYEGADVVRFDIVEPTNPRRNEFNARARDLGIWGDKHIPESYLLAGTEQRRALLAGLLDTDGTISKQGQIEIVTMRLQFAQDMLYLARSLGHRATLRTGTAKIGTKEYGTKYRIYFTPNGNPFTLQRHRDRYKPQGSRGPRRTTISLESIEPVDSVPVRCISVDSEDELFLAGANLLATLNTNGKHKAVLTNRRLWRVATASRKGARSLSVDLAMLDELREHTSWDAYNAIAPTTTVRPYSQVICTSNAGDSRSEVLRSLRDAAEKRITTGDTEATKVGLWEWSVPMGEDPNDPQFWYMALPAMGNIGDFTIDTVMGFYESMHYKNMAGFRTEYLCQWVDSIEPGIIPAIEWQNGLDPNSCRAEGAPVYAALDVNYDRSHAYIAIATRREDGYAHIEVVQAARGLDWVIPWLRERKGKFKGVAVQKTGAPASGMIIDLLEAGVPVVEWGPGAELAAGCGLFYDNVVQETMYHRPSLVLDRAAASTIARRAGDAWIFDRRNSPVDAAPLVACAAALWLMENYVDPSVPNVHEWPAEDVLAVWEKEAEELWKDSDDR